MPCRSFHWTNGLPTSSDTSTRLANRDCCLPLPINGINLSEEGYDAIYWVQDHEERDAPDYKEIPTWLRAERSLYLTRTSMPYLAGVTALHESLFCAGPIWPTFTHYPTRRLQAFQCHHSPSVTPTLSCPIRPLRVRLHTTIEASQTSHPPLPCPHCLFRPLSDTLSL